MRKIIFLTPAEAEYGFSLAGAAQRVVAPGHETSEALYALSREPEVGLVAVDERLLAGVDSARVDEVRARGMLLVVLPSPIHPGAVAEDYAATLIRRTVGYHLRLTG